MVLKEGFSEMLKIVCTILSRPESDAFRYPVDWKALELFDYPEIVKSPMDLGTVKKGIESGKYGSIEDIANDIRLVWSNCMLYNRDGSEFYHLADSFSTAFEDAYSALRRLRDSNAKSDKDRVPTVHERMQMSHDIFKLDSVELAAVLSMIESSSPSALSRRVAHDEVLINIDALKSSCYHEVNEFILSCLLARGGNKKKRKNTTATSADSGPASSSSTTTGVIPKSKKIKG